MSQITKNDSVFTMSIAELMDRVARARRLFAEIGGLLPGLATLTDDNRRHSDGKLSDGEGDALGSVIGVAERHPQYFAALADKDGGVDPRTFETSLLRNHLTCQKIISDLATAAVALMTPLGDTLLVLGE